MKVFMRECGSVILAMQPKILEIRLFGINLKMNINMALPQFIVIYPMQGNNAYSYLYIVWVIVIRDRVKK